MYRGFRRALGPVLSHRKEVNKISEEGKDRGQTTNRTLVLETIRLIADLLLAAFL